MCWQKALSDKEISTLIDTFVRAYIRQVRWFVEVEDDSSFSLNLETARGAVRAALWARGKPAGLYGMDDVLNLKS